MYKENIPQTALEFLKKEGYEIRQHENNNKYYINDIAITQENLYHINYLFNLSEIKNNKVNIFKSLDKLLLLIENDFFKTLKYNNNVLELFKNINCNNEIVKECKYYTTIKRSHKTGLYSIIQK